eukprot:scaffold237170_cov18-Tisochrysis_lutea.AAC.1
MRTTAMYEAKRMRAPLGLAVRGRKGQEKRGKERKGKGRCEEQGQEKVSFQSTGNYICMLFLNRGGQWVGSLEVLQGHMLLQLGAPDILWTLRLIQAWVTDSMSLESRVLPTDVLASKVVAEVFAATR